jgi:hypothetical protein
MNQSPAPLTGSVGSRAHAAPIASAFRSLGQLYLRAEKHVAWRGPRVVLRARQPPGSRGSDPWLDVPAWRFFRHVVRVGLFLRERCKLQPGERVLVVAPLRAERIVVEWAVVAQGAVVATLDPATPDDALATALGHLAPRVVVGDGGVAHRMRQAARRAGGSIDHLIVIDVVNGVAGPGPTENPTDTTWSAVMELGGILDTAERAQTFRAAARAVNPEAPAIAYLDLEAKAPKWKTASHGAIVGRIVDIWRASHPRPGAVAYVVEPGEYGGLRLALWALVADGETTLALGTPQHEAQEQEIAELAPDLVVGPIEALERALRSSRRPPRAGSSRVAEWLRHAAFSAPLLAPLARARRAERLASRASPPRQSLTLEGTSWPVTLTLSREVLR